MIGFNHVLKFDPLTPIYDPDDVTFAKIEVASNGFRFRISSGIIIPNFNRVPKKCRIPSKFFDNRLNYIV